MIWKKNSRILKSHHSESFKIISAKTDVYKYSFLPNTVKDWNSLPPDLISNSKSAKNPVEFFNQHLRL